MPTISSREENDRFSTFLGLVARFRRRHGPDSHGLGADGDSSTKRMREAGRRNGRKKRRGGEFGSDGRQVREGERGRHGCCPGSRGNESGKGING